MDVVVSKSHNLSGLGPRHILDISYTKIKIFVYCPIRRWRSKLGTKDNQSPKGNMWSAIPVALLCMKLNLSDGKQGSGPEGDEVL